MANSNKVFPGRVIFDHIPKTAGQAINNWLSDALGPGCVTPNLIGKHTNLIRKFGGMFSVISGHINFNEAEGLDPRYNYLTVIREPIERIISLLYFLMNDAILPAGKAELKVAAKQFLESDGEDISDQRLANDLRNKYVKHFCTINGSLLASDDDKIANALATIKQYDVVGLYQDMPQFLADVAVLLGLPAQKQAMTPVNVTTGRPDVSRISTALRARIIEMNQLDIRLYNEVLAWKAATYKENSALKATPEQAKWKRYERTFAPAICINTPHLTILNAGLREGRAIVFGQLMTFEVDFLLAREVNDIEIHLQIYDSYKQVAFGISNAMLGQSYHSLPEGVHHVSFQMPAGLDLGNYMIGLSFNEQLPDGQKDVLGRHDELYGFSIIHVNLRYGGYFYLPAEIHLTQSTTKYVYQGDGSRLSTIVGTRAGNVIVASGQAGFLIYGPYLTLVPGSYQVFIHCAVGKGGLAGARMEIITGGGNQVIAKGDFEEPDGAGCFVIPILLDTPCTDLEVRVWVTENTDLQISKLEIAFWHGQQ